VERQKANFQLAFGIILVLIAVVTVAESLRFSLPMIRRGVASMYDFPGLVPIVASVILSALAAPFMVMAAKQGGSLQNLFSKESKALLASDETRIVCLVFGLLIAYRTIFNLIPYVLSTTAFLLMFYLALGVLSVRTGLLAAAVSGMFFVLFQLVFKISLP
jgi:hypothetical protein